MSPGAQSDNRGRGLRGYYFAPMALNALGEGADVPVKARLTLSGGQTRAPFNTHASRRALSASALSTRHPAPIRIAIQRPATLSRTTPRTG